MNHKKTQTGESISPRILPHCIENFMKGMKFKMLELEENYRLLEELKVKLQNLGESL